MLLNLHVKNFALIDEIDIDFSKGLNILTGETGAGKSIVLGSLAIALGAKADKDFIRTGEEFALVEITFSADTDEVKNKLIENDISLENDCVLIQRKITPQRSVFKLNSQTVTVSVIKDIASALIDIYGQHDYQNLLNSRKHIEILDSFAKDISDVASGYKKTYAEYLRLKTLAESPEVDEVRREREISLLEYQINEIKSASLKVNEEEEVEERLKVLENAYKIQSTLSLVKDMMYDYESSAGEMINKSIREMTAISSYDSALGDLFDELNNIYSLVSDFERETYGLLEDYAPNEEELERLRERYNLINELERKYGRTIENVLEYLDDKEKELEALEDYAIKRESILKDYEKAKEALKKSADALTEVRKKNAKSFEEAITEGLSDLNFNQSSFNVAITEAPDYTANGKDKVNFEISTNPGEPLKPLENVSSGGELSRIMLAIKTVGAKSDNTETLIFDEIDAGISGVTAWKVAKKLALLSKDHQIILITHLQQIAAMADVHFEIKKTVSDNSRTNTYIDVLDEEGEIKEIARMLGDESGAESFLENASEIKKQALDYKKSIDI
ncbi:DNA repair protein RecN (Recombination protein N) [Lachnospiraceae bacterium G41]|nr:DNA repair protein RecN (Recombination protein N) [Lachnospiraceae bacterium G41]